MTPKEKANELFDKYYVLILQTESDISEELQISILAEKLALIAVDEKIKTVQDICDIKNGMTKEELEHITFLLDVKNEIEKL